MFFLPSHKARIWWSSAGKLELQELLSNWNRKDLLLSPPSVLKIKLLLRFLHAYLNYSQMEVVLCYCLNAISCSSASCWRLWLRYLEVYFWIFAYSLEGISQQTTWLSGNNPQHGSRALAQARRHGVLYFSLWVTDCFYKSSLGSISGFP